MGSTPEFRKAFVARLKQACDESKLIPLPGQGRQQMIANRLGVGAEAVSKWFKGVSMPRPDKMSLLADMLDTDQSWLAFGIEPEMDRSERHAHVRETDGAVNLVLGLMQLAGAHVGLPSARDPRSAYIDFYSTIRGSVYPVCVTLARNVGRDQFTVIVPDQFEQARVVVVVPVGNSRYDSLDIPFEVIKEYKQRSKEGLAITLTHVGSGKYAVGVHQLDRIKNFAEFK